MTVKDYTMPMYEYECKACKHTFEQLVWKVDDRLAPCKAKCPECGKKKVEQKIGAPAIADAIQIGLTKPNNGFKEVIQKIKKDHKKHTMNDRFF
jgi:putative FmdB family regulatory protein